MIKETPAKIMIFGCPGSGKSTFAYELHQATKISLHHLDKHFFESNWIERDYSEFLSIQQSIVDTDSWIIDGNSMKSLEIRYAKADLVLYFNYPLLTCYWRVFKRRLKKNAQIDDRASGCKERIRFALLRYMWNYKIRTEKQIITLKNQYPVINFFEIKNDKDLQYIKAELTRLKT